MSVLFQALRLSARENRNLKIGFFVRAPVKHAGDRKAKVSLRGDEWDAEIAEIAEIAAAPARRRHS